MSNLLINLNCSLGLEEIIACLKLIHQLYHDHPKKTAYYLKKPHSHSNQTNHTNMIKQCISNNETFKYRFLVQSTKDWNLLPEEFITICETQSFEGSLAKHFQEILEFTLSLILHVEYP